MVTGPDNPVIALSDRFQKRYSTSLLSTNSYQTGPAGPEQLPPAYQLKQFGGGLLPPYAYGISMSALEDARQKPTRTELLESLTDGRRRQVLRLLGDREGQVAVSDVADHLAANADDASTDAATKRARTQLRHAVLPRLEAAGLVQWDDQEGTVATTDHPAYDDPQFRQVLETEAEGWDDVVACLADERRNTVLAVLDARGEPVERTELAREVAVREADGAASAEAVERLRAELHHVHLPRLAAAGLVEYDVEAGHVTYDGHPQLPRSAPFALSSL